MKVVINRCYGWFSLSHEAIMRYLEIKGLPCFVYEHDYSTNKYSPVSGEPSWRWSYFTRELGSNPPTREEYSQYHFYSRDLDRNDPILVQVVEELGPRAYGEHAQLKVVEIPDGTNYEIDDYDGKESISEVHQKWY